jgi:hypothetical protein
MKVPDMIKPTDNFWEYNPQYAIILADLYDNDKTKNKLISSKIAWAIYFRHHPDSDFYNLKNRDEIIQTKWIKDTNFKWEDYQDTIELFVDSILSQAKKSLHNWDEMLRKRDAFIHNQDFTLDSYDENGKIVKGTADQLDKMLGNTHKLYSEYFKIRKELSDEELKRGKGNKPLSMSDSGEI